MLLFTEGASAEAAVRGQPLVAGVGPL